eukprot:g5022.t1
MGAGHRPRSAGAGNYDDHLRHRALLVNELDPSAVRASAQAARRVADFKAKRRREQEEEEMELQNLGIDVGGGGGCGGGGAGNASSSRVQLSCAGGKWSRGPSGTFRYRAKVFESPRDWVEAGRTVTNHTWSQSLRTPAAGPGEDLHAKFSTGYAAVEVEGADQVVVNELGEDAIGEVGSGGSGDGGGGGGAEGDRSIVAASPDPAGSDVIDDWKNLKTMQFRSAATSTTTTTTTTTTPTRNTRALRSGVAPSPRDGNKEDVDVDNLERGGDDEDKNEDGHDGGYDSAEAIRRTATDIVGEIANDWDPDNDGYHGADHDPREARVAYESSRKQHAREYRARKRQSDLIEFLSDLDPDQAGDIDIPGIDSAENVAKSPNSRVQLPVVHAVTVVSSSEIAVDKMSGEVPKAASSKKEEDARRQGSRSALSREADKVLQDARRAQKRMRQTRRASAMMLGHTDYEGDPPVMDRGGSGGGGGGGGGRASSSKSGGPKAAAAEGGKSPTRRDPLNNSSTLRLFHGGYSVSGQRLLITMSLNPVFVRLQHGSEGWQTSPEEAGFSNNLLNLPALRISAFRPQTGALHELSISLAGLRQLQAPSLHDLIQVVRRKGKSVVTAHICHANSGGDDGTMSMGTQYEMVRFLLHRLLLVKDGYCDGGGLRLTIAKRKEFGSVGEVEAEVFNAKLGTFHDVKRRSVVGEAADVEHFIGKPRDDRFQLLQKLSGVYSQKDLTEAFVSRQKRHAEKAFGVAKDGSGLEANAAGDKAKGEGGDDGDDIAAPTKASKALALFRAAAGEVRELSKPALELRQRLAERQQKEKKQSGWAKARKILTISKAFGKAFKSVAENASEDAYKHAAPVGLVNLKVLKAAQNVKHRVSARRKEAKISLEVFQWMDTYRARDMLRVVMDE